MVNKSIAENIGWLLNKVHTHEVWGRPEGSTHNLASETLPLVPDLVQLNKSSFFTICSQPTILDQNDWKQVAFVSGYVEPGVYHKAKAMTSRVDYPNICFSWDEPCKHDKSGCCTTYITGGIPQTYGCGHYGDFFCGRSEFSNKTENVYRSGRYTDINGWVYTVMHSMCWDDEDVTFWPTVVAIFKEANKNE